MPRRAKPDALSLSIGARIRQLREEAGLTMEQLAYESELSSKGHLSNIERGLVRPTAHTLSLLAERLAVELGDLVNFPEEAGDRGRLYELTRRMAGPRVRVLLHEAEDIVARQPRLRAAEGTSGYRRHRRRGPTSDE
ncbi:MAG TPA: helix-turn-helix transcriptional regulator [Polyangia bacterium]|nr:helix-turn-helix transcriptional regulator [Polyangia bacterium]